MSKNTLRTWTSLLVLYTMFPVPSFSEDAEILFDHAQNPVGGTEGHNSTHFKDVTHFVGGINGWDFSGVWGKHDPSSLPVNPERQDQAVFICYTSTQPSILEKGFPAMEKVNLTLSYFLSSRDMDLGMQGIVKAAGKTEIIFDFSEPADTHEHNNTWVVQHFHLPEITKEANFTLQFILRSYEEETARTLSDIWATDEIVVEGFKVTSLPIVGPGGPEPEVNATTAQPETNSTGPVIATNVTIETNVTEEFVNVTTVASNVTVDTNQTTDGTNGTNIGINATGNGTDNIGNGTATEAPTNVGGSSSSFSDHLSKLAGVAEAIWNAFYVFLALFCACLIALVGLIVRGRCKDNDNPPPSVATYNPRTASYRLDKVYDNAGYDTNAV